MFHFDWIVKSCDYIWFLGGGASECQSKLSQTLDSNTSLKILDTVTEFIRKDVPVACITDAD